MDSLALPHYQQATGKVTLPGSKSISNRILLLAALSEGDTIIRDLLDSDDISRMKEALISLGIAIQADNTPNCFKIQGAKKSLPNKKAELFLGNAGTAFRPLTAALALNQGEYRLYGVPRMHERPIGDLVSALQDIGCDIAYEQNAGYPPLLIKQGQVRSQVVQVKGNVSSQFLTALLLTLPMLEQETKVEVIGELISKPYIAITLNLLEKFGIFVENHQWQSFVIPAHSQYSSPREIWVEGDASSASYFLAAGAIAGKVRVKGVGKDSIQGDAKFADAIAKMGAIITYGDNFISAEKPQQGLKAIELDCNEIPDAAMTLAVMALYAEGTTKLTNIASWRVKETDRIAAMATELRKVGANVVEGDDFIEITPKASYNADTQIATYDDHRMAMCFSLVAFATSVIILDPNCVAKTFPHYFTEFAKIAH